jgi:phenylacetate-coenzyme A ligase PaaK-like adenylate-forming protein
VNVYPSAIQDVLAAFPEIVEHRMNVLHHGTLTELHLEIEPAPACVNRPALQRAAQSALYQSLSLRIEVTTTEPNFLPRFEMKAKRWIHHQA